MVWDGCQSPPISIKLKAGKDAHSRRKAKFTFQKFTMYVLMNTLKINIISFLSYIKNNQFSSTLDIRNYCTYNLKT